MSVAFEGIQTAVKTPPDGAKAGKIDLQVARQVLAEALEVIALSTTDQTVQDIALDTLGMDRFYNGVLAEVARAHDPSTEQACEAVGKGKSRRRPFFCGPVLWIRRKDVERD